MKGMERKVWCVALILALLLGGPDFANASGKIRNVSGTVSTEIDKIEVPIIEGDLLRNDQGVDGKEPMSSEYRIVIDQSKTPDFTVPVFVHKDCVLSFFIQLEIDGTIKAYLSKDEAGMEVVYRFGNQGMDGKNGQQTVSFHKANEFVPVSSGEYYLHLTAQDVGEGIKKIPVSLTLFGCVNLEGPIQMSPIMDNMDIKILATAGNGQEDVYQIIMKKEGCMVPAIMPMDTGEEAEIDDLLLQASLYQEQKEVKPICSYGKLPCYALDKGTYELHVKTDQQVYLMLYASGFVNKTSTNKKGAGTVQPYVLGYFRQEDKKGKTSYYKWGRKEDIAAFDVLFWGNGSIEVTLYYPDGSKKSKTVKGGQDIVIPVDDEKAGEGTSYISVKKKGKAEGVYLFLPS